MPARHGWSELRSRPAVDMVMNGNCLLATARVMNHLGADWALLDRNLSTVHDVDAHAPDQVQEPVTHSWYDYSGGKEQGLHPYDGETNLNYTGPKPPYELDVDQGCSWLKSPLWKGKEILRVKVRCAWAPVPFAAIDSQECTDLRRSPALPYTPSRNGRGTCRDSRALARQQLRHPLGRHPSHQPTP